MANTLRIKRRATGSPGAPTSLQNAELAYNEVDNTLYYGKGTGGAGGTATTVDAIGGAGSFVDKSTAQTVGGVKTFSSIPVAPTATAGDSSTQVATTSFVTALVNPVTSANFFKAGPASGAASVPTFRALVIADLPTLSSTNISDFSAAADARIALQKGVANGIASLDGSGKLPVSQLPASVFGSLNYQGSFDVAAGAGVYPASPAKGYYYIASTAGSLTFSAVTTAYSIGDWLTFDGTTWDKVEGQNNVSSVAGRTGAVVLTKSDVGLSAVPNIDATLRANHTGTQLSSTISDFASAVIAQLLTGLSTVTSTVVTATDSILIAIGKLQAQVSLRLIAANNLSDLGSAVTARTNLGLGSAALLASTAVLQTANNLSDLATPATARTNLGLGSMATQNASAVAITGGTIDAITFDGGIF